MKLRFTISCWLLCLLPAGCEPPAREPAQGTGPRGRVTGEGVSSPSVPAAAALASASGFAPAKINVLPLTEFSGPSNTGPSTTLHVFVALLDAFGSQIKTPGVLRLELYEYVPRSARAKGRRLAIWPDIDLTRPAENHRYWQDFLRAYEFELDIQVGRDKPYILEATCLCLDGRRLAGEYLLKSSP